MQNSIVELGTVLKEIAYRKQFEVEVTRPALTTSMENLRVDQEINRKDLKIKFDINSTQQEDLQVSRLFIHAHQCVPCKEKSQWNFKKKTRIRHTHNTIEFFDVHKFAFRSPNF